MKRVVDVPVIAVGRIHDPALAERILREGSADLVAMARPLLADPAFASKLALGRAREVRRCISCQNCIDAMEQRGSVDCAVNPRTGRIVLTPMLNESGKLIGDFTIAARGADRFMIWGSSAAQKYHMRWFERHLPGDGSVRVHRFDQTLVGLAIAGPLSQALLGKLADEDVSTPAFRFMDFREMAVGGAPCMVNRISYTFLSR